MPLKFNPNATGFDIKNARYLAEASKLAYADDLATIVAGLGEEAEVAPFKAKRWDFDTQGYVARLPGAVILAFRGTEPKKFKDWITDLHATPAAFDWIFKSGPPIGNIHAGFGHALADTLPAISEPFRAALQQRKGEAAPPRLFITGHSLGGALAALAAGVCSFLDGWIYPIAGLYTYGQPRVSTHVASNTFDREFGARHFRCVNHDDLVPRVPPRSFDYTHIGTVIHFLPPKGFPLPENPEQASWIRGAFADLSMFGGLVTEGGEEIQYHLLDSKIGYLNTMDAYLSALGAGKAKPFKL